MSEPAAILDYASPRPQGKFRLPSRSNLKIESDRDGLSVTETLAVKGYALLALGVGVLTLVVFCVQAVTFYLSWREAGHAGVAELIAAECVPFGLGTTELIVMLLVINNTWRRTVLRASEGELSLDFLAPLGNQHYEWPFDQIIELGVDRTLEPGFVDHRRDLTFRATGGQLVRLFTDHSEYELDTIATGLEQILASRRASAIQ